MLPVCTLSARGTSLVAPQMGSTKSRALRRPLQCQVEVQCTFAGRSGLVEVCAWEPRSAVDHAAWGRPQAVPDPCLAESHGRTAMGGAGCRSNSSRPLGSASAAVGCAHGYSPASPTPIPIESRPGPCLGPRRPSDHALEHTERLEFAYVL